MSKKGEIEASMRNCCGRVLLFESERQWDCVVLFCFGKVKIFCVPTCCIPIVTIIHKD
jgi:hypothetical protein